VKPKLLIYHVLDFLKVYKKEQGGLATGTFSKNIKEDDCDITQLLESKSILIIPGLK
jgi:hypothetical protein